jgi:hypothetical protein
MRHASPQDDRVERVAMAAPPNWRTAIGLCSPTSDTEVVYGSPDEYDEEDPPAQSPSPAIKKRRHEELEKDLDEISTGSDEYDPTGKTPVQLDAIIAKYKRDATASRIAAAKRRRIFEGNRWFPALRGSLFSHLARCAEVETVMNRRAAEKMDPVNPKHYPQDGGRSLCSAQVHGNTNPPHYARIRAQQQQAEEAERGQHLQKQLSSAASFLDIRAKGGRSTKADDVEYFLRRMAASAGGEGNDFHISIKVLSKNEAMLTAEDELVWARERFRADCAAWLSALTRKHRFQLMTTRSPRYETHQLGQPALYLCSTPSFWSRPRYIIVQVCACGLR